MKRYKRNKLLIGLVVLLIALAVAGVLIKSRNSLTLTGYEDTNGVIYQCSKPIKARNSDAIIGLLGHPQGLIPANQNEANKYCHSAGIE
ncbi:MAG TPA: hypothetical protein VFW90_02805 [Candidatus Saccharimonadales bacterium]|nr:hypothetical protein [Candidatus Saccharimonadales bacterium]